MRIILYLGLTLLGTLAASNEAIAKCQSPDLFLIPEGGSKLPPNPVVYLFVPGGREKPRIALHDQNHSPVAFQLEEMGGPPAFTAFRIRVEAEVGTNLDIDVKGSVRWHTTYSVTAPCKRSASKPVIITKVESKTSSWTCSFEHTQSLSL